MILFLFGSRTLDAVGAGEPYYVYDLNLRFSDGRTKSIRVEAAQYNRTRTGATLTLPMERGLLGWPVITRSLEAKDTEN